MVLEPFYVCVAARLALVVLAYRLEEDGAVSSAHRKQAAAAAAAAAAAIGVGFLAVWGRRMRAFESTARAGRVWWNDLRPLHAALWLLYAALAARSVPRAWTVLLLDLVVGIAAWKHFRRR